MLIDEPPSIATVAEDLPGPPCSNDHDMSLMHGRLYSVLPCRLAK